MKRLASTAIAAALAVAVSGAATVPVGTYVCNPGAVVRVPAELDGASGISGVAVTLAYDPQVVVFSHVESGALAETFPDDFLVSDDGNGTVSAAMIRLAGNVSGEVSGTIATFVFLVRNGTEGQFSDITVTKVELLEESGVRDAALGCPVTTKNGMIRVMDADAAAARMEEAQTVVADTRLGSLALAAGDAIQASDAGTAIVVSGEVEAPGPVPVAAPDGGWATAAYTLLKTETAGLEFVEAGAAGRLDVVEDRTGGVSTYTLVMDSVDGIAVLSLDDDLDASLQAYVRECVGDAPGVDTVWVSGGADAVSLARAFGIRPALSAGGRDAEAVFAKPGLRVVAFDPAAGTVTAAVEPREGNTIAGNGKVTGIVELLGSDELGREMVPADRVEIDLSSYFSPDTAGQVRCRATFGRNRFFRVRIADE
ncbi:MAG: hypothetical protein IJ783_11330 [Kiritimatiellae bacterium]|nr:hypothetical protein [Kiritimatiellia bacterium]